MRLKLAYTAAALGLIVLMLSGRGAIALSPSVPPDNAGELIEKLKRLATGGNLSNVEWAEAVFGAKLERTSANKPGWLGIYEIYEPLPIRHEGGVDLGDVRSMLPGHPDLFQRTSLDYRVANPGYTGPFRNWDKNCVAVFAFYHIEEYVCIYSINIWQRFDDTARIRNRLGRVCGEYPEYTYGYSLQRNGGIETDLLIWGPDRGQDGCVHNVALVERRTD